MTLAPDSSSVARWRRFFEIGGIWVALWVGFTGVFNESLVMRTRYFTVPEVELLASFWGESLFFRTVPLRKSVRNKYLEGSLAFVNMTLVYFRRFEV
jgi:hypothetical protein